MEFGDRVWRQRSGERGLERAGVWIEQSKENIEIERGGWRVDIFIIYCIHVLNFKII